MKKLTIFAVAFGVAAACFAGPHGFRPGLRPMPPPVHHHYYHHHRHPGFVGSFVGGIVGGIIGSTVAPQPVVVTTPAVVQTSPVVVAQPQPVVTAPVVVMPPATQVVVPTDLGPNWVPPPRPLVRRYDINGRVYYTTH